MATPVAHTIQSACETYNIGRTSLYELLKAGTLQARKFGAKTLIDDASLREWYDSLPSQRTPKPNRPQANNKAQPAATV
jgi:excisionase family DNA binding protein